MMLRPRRAFRVDATRRPFDGAHGSTRRLLLARYDDLRAFVRRHYRTLLPFLTLRRAANVLLAVAERALNRTVCRSRPFMLRVDPSTFCNLACPSCATTWARNDQKRMLTLAEFETIVDRLGASALRISLYDQGEPLTNKDLYAMIGHATSRRISTLISTNFTLFDEGDLDRLFDSGLTVLEPCLDGITQETYGTYRRGGDVEVVKRNISLVTRAKRERGAKWPIVDAQVISFRHLREELPDIEAFLRTCGVDAITHKKEIMGFDAPEATAPAAAPSRPETPTCFWLYFGMTVRPDGNAYPCCGRGFERFAYGNVIEEDLDEIWNNDYYRFSRALFAEGPDLPYDERMSRIPCLTCTSFTKRRDMQAAPERTATMDAEPAASAACARVD